jgi:hypothetical protein
LAGPESAAAGLCADQSFHWIVQAFVRENAIKLDPADVVASMTNRSPPDVQVRIRCD